MMAVPAEVMDHGMLELMVVPEARSVDEVAEPASFFDFLRQLPYHEQRVMGRISLPLDECEGLAELLREGTAEVYFVSDGLVRARRAGHAWMVVCDAVGMRANGAGLCDGNPDTVDSFWAEYTGLLAMAYFF